MMAPPSKKSSKQKQHNAMASMSLESMQDAEGMLKKLNSRQGLIQIMLGQSQDEEYNPAEPNNFENMLIRRKRLKHELETKIKKEEALKKHIEEQSRSAAVPSEIDLEMSAEDAYQARLRRS